MLASHCIIDGFLGAAAAQDLLDFALANEAGFSPSLVYNNESGSGVRSESRHSFRFEGDWKAQRKGFRAAIESRIEEIVSGAGSAGFRPDQMEIELVATRDGGHFIRHIDTRTKVLDTPTDRIVSAVYYFHREPQAFSGGELILHALVGEERLAIEPRHDRLVVFTSIAPHEVNRTAVPGDAFADGRFSINCWLHRNRPAGAARSG
ncbi:2OG-Fe(II) oxygenase [Erythrobacter sp. JK5]|uniref:2OG-Fe(II) oxygenase n=1 Tax=Erythrobacter sp. JK5 TaxID=2829500 RepID=UPI001BA50457|nr:2OG-Fe(II) oxygenase [Erythrobacter sp. JK5]QUL38281.1 2OG-Fe(II) oxygenase [Erythrobacter sp. JK5]